MEYFIKKGDIFKQDTSASEYGTSTEVLLTETPNTTRRKRRFTTTLRPDQGSARPDGKIPVLVKKIAKRPIFKPTLTRKSDSGKSQLCNGVLECQEESGQSSAEEIEENSNEEGSDKKNYVVSRHLCTS